MMSCNNQTSALQSRRHRPPANLRSIEEQLNHTDPEVIEECDDCCLCLEPMSSSSSTCSLQCGHFFHTQCCHRLKMSPLKQVCPLCRAEFSLTGKELAMKASRYYGDLRASKPNWNSLTIDQDTLMQEVIAMWLESAEQGEAASMFNLGLISRSGNGIPQDNVNAFKWFENAAILGHAGAQTNLGFMLNHGIGVAQPDFEEAAKWYLEASVKGYADAQFNLGCLYECGDGVEKSQEEAKRWYSIATLSGSKQAGAALERLNKSMIAPKIEKKSAIQTKKMKMPLSSSRSKSRYLIVNDF